MADVSLNTDISITIPALVNISIADLKSNETAPVIGTYSIDARVKGAFARIRTEFEIVNNNNRVFEGELEFPLPDGGVVCGYAIDIDGVMTDAAVVEKEKARIAFENEVKKGVDPGLVEQVRGNAYRTRIYPILAHGSRRIRLDYVVPLVFGSNGDAALALPMPSEKLARRDVEVTVDIPGCQPPTLGGLGDKRFAQAELVWRVESHEQNVSGDDHLLIGIPALPDIFTTTENFDDDIFFATSARIEPKSDTDAHVEPKAWRIIWDASGSRTPADIEKSLDLIACLPQTASYDLVVFRNKPDSTKSFNTRDALLDALKTTIYDGGTDYAPLCNLPAFDGMTLFFSDGFDTFTRALPEFGLNAVALTSASTRDLAVLRRICGGHVIDLRVVNPKDAYAQILAPASVISTVSGDGLTSIQGIGLAAIGRVTVLGRVKSSCNAQIVLSDGRSFPFKVDQSSAKPGNTLASAWASRRIDELSPNADDNREELLSLGRHFSIVSPVSSMIVFENLNQWLQYDIEPPKSNKDLHERWLKQRSTQSTENERKKKNWSNDLMNIWKARLKWYDDPVPKIETPSSGLFGNVINAAQNVAHRVAAAMGSIPGAALGGQPVRDSAMPGAAPAAAPAMRRSAPRDVDAEVCLEDACCEEACCEECRREPEAESGAPAPQNTGTQASITIQAWTPDTPYLNAIKDAYKIFNEPDSLYTEYLKQRKNYATSPSFFLDCASLFFKENQHELAVRILSNLAELRLDDISLIRVYAWRLREAGELDDAILLLRKAAKMRPDEAVSWRDLALTLTMRAKKNHSAADAQEALEYFHRAAFEPNNRRDALYTAVVAIEEFNALASWCEKQKWNDKAPVIPAVSSEYRKDFDLDLRIVLMWDADSTDIDLHVLEPSGEEVFYSHKRSRSGAMNSDDVTTGYGPEEYLHKKAPAGTYQILSNYFSSHQQKLVGPVTVTATVFTNWARDNEESKIMSLRLEKAKDHHLIGTIDVK